MPLIDPRVEMFFADPTLDEDLPFVNEIFWSALIKHIERDYIGTPHSILDIGCHTGGLLLKLHQRFSPKELIGIEPLAGAREAAMQRLKEKGANPRLLTTSEWDFIPSESIDLVCSHEALYLEPNIEEFLNRLRKVLSLGGFAYLVLGCHSENPLWFLWKQSLIAAGKSVYDHAPLEIMAAASAAGLLSSVQPLRTSGWITYDPQRAYFQYPDITAMFDHHYRLKLIFRLQVAT